MKNCYSFPIRNYPLIKSIGSEMYILKDLKQYHIIIIITRWYIRFKIELDLFQKLTLFGFVLFSFVHYDAFDNINFLNDAKVR